MSWVYTEQDFFGIVDDDYTKYIADKTALRRVLYRNNFQGLQNQKILIAGCGFGEMVQALTDEGFTDVWGCDASTYGINEGKLLYPAIASRLLVGDILSQSSLNSVRSAAGLNGNQRFRLVVSEDVLPCMANSTEVQTALTRMRAISQSLAHIISIWDEGSYTYRHADGSIRYLNGDVVMRMPGFLWWTEAEWISAVNNLAEWVFKPDGTRVQ